MLQRSGIKNCSSCYYSWLTYNCTDDRDLVLSHLIMLADDEFLKEHCDSVTPAPPPNYVSASNQTSGMLAALVNNLKKKESPLRPRIFSTSTQLYFSLSLSRKLSNNFSFKLYFTQLSTFI